MSKTTFGTGNSLFGKVLTAVLREYNITANALYGECGICRSYFFNIKKGWATTA